MEEKKGHWRVWAVTWNILAQRFDETPWREKRTKIFELLSLKTYDIICLQEVELRSDVKEDIIREHSHDYYVSFNTKGKKHKSTMGSLTMVRKYTFDLPERIEQTSSGLLVRVRHISSGVPFDILNVHLKAGLNHGECRRVEQLWSCFTKLVERDSESVLLLCGDFNDNFYNMEEDGLWAVLQTHGCLWTPCPYATCNVSARLFPFDHAFSNTLKVWYDECPWTAEQLYGLPEPWCPSDHVPVGFSLNITPQTVYFFSFSHSSQ